MDINTAWLAGMVEGEGCINRSKTRNYPSWSLTINSTDHDVLLRVAAAAGVGNVTGPINQKQNANWKPYWRWSVTRRHDILTVLQRIRPLLGERRGARADEFFEWHATHTYQGHETGECRRGHTLSKQQPLIIGGRLTCRVCQNDGRRRRYAERMAEGTYRRFDKKKGSS